MLLPILDINLRQSSISNNQHILSILLFSRFGEIEAPRDHDLPVADHDLVVGDGVPGVYVCGDAGIRQEGRRRVFP